MENEDPRLPCLLRLPIEILVAVWLIIDGIVAPLFRPVMRFLSSLRIVQKLEKAIAALPPYVVLVLIFVPFVLAEFAKVYAVVLMAEDHVRAGMTIFVGAYVVSILVCERIFHAGKGQLMRIGWFKLVFEWLTAIKAKVFGWVRDTRLWRRAANLRQRLAARLWRALWPSAFGLRPRGSFERRS